MTTALALAILAGCIAAAFGLIRARWLPSPWDPSSGASPFARWTGEVARYGLGWLLVVVGGGAVRVLLSPSDSAKIIDGAVSLLFFGAFLVAASAAVAAGYRVVQHVDEADARSARDRQAAARGERAEGQA